MQQRRYEGHLSLVRRDNGNLGGRYAEVNLDYVSSVIDHRLADRD